MVAPLVILSVPTVLAGLLLGLPPEGGAIHTWLEPVFRGAEEAGAGIQPGSIAATGARGLPAHRPGGLLLTVTAIGGAALGIWLAYRWYVRDAGRRRRASSSASRSASGRACTPPA